LQVDEIFNNTFLWLVEQFMCNAISKGKMCTKYSCINFYECKYDKLVNSIKMLKKHKLTKTHHVIHSSGQLWHQKFSAMTTM